MGLCHSAQLRSHADPDDRGPAACLEHLREDEVAE